MIGVVGLGNVGKALYDNFINHHDVVGYDKDASKTVDAFDSLLECDILFLCLPTPTHSGMYKNTGLGAGQTIQAIYNVMADLRHKKYKGIVVLKSTVLPGTTRKLAKECPEMTVLNNPEFLSQKTAYTDFKDQKKIIIGGDNKKAMKKVADLFKPLAVKTCYFVDWTEAETVKYMHNVFLAVKIATFNELYDACKERKTNYDLCAHLACEITNWINPRHVQVPGPDGQFGYGGDCFPKDISAFLTRYHHLDLDIIKTTIQSNFNRRKGGSKAPQFKKDAYEKYFLTKPAIKKRVASVG